MLSKTKLIQSVVYFAVQTFLCSFCSLFILLITHQGKKKSLFKSFGKQIMIYEILQIMIWYESPMQLILFWLLSFPINSLNQNNSNMMIKKMIQLLMNLNFQ